jgi:hypothetical protein
MGRTALIIGITGQDDSDDYVVATGERVMMVRADRDRLRAL